MTISHFSPTNADNHATHVTMTDETWKPVVGWEGIYEVSDLGRVRSLKRQPPKIMTGQPHENGYVRYTLTGSGLKTTTRKAHRLVLEAFVGPRPDGMMCRHLDGDPSNNRLDNLRWGTPRENEADKVAHGTAPIGENHPRSRLTAGLVREIRDLHQTGRTAKQIGIQMAVTESYVRDIISKRRWVHVE